MFLKEQALLTRELDTTAVGMPLLLSELMTFADNTAVGMPLLLSELMTFADTTAVGMPLLLSELMTFTDQKLTDNRMDDNN